MTTAEADTSVEEHLYKVLVIGDFGVGEFQLLSIQICFIFLISCALLTSRKGKYTCVE